MRALDIRNACLGALGESPLASEQDYHPFVADIAAAIEAASIQALARGWWFNTEHTSLYPQVDGTIRVPNDAYSCVPDSNTLFGLRGNRLWNSDKNTDQWAAPLKVRLIRRYPLDDLPYLAGEYIKAKAVVYFIRKKDADQGKIRDAEKEEQEAYGNLHAEHIRATRMNYRDVNPLSVALAGRSLYRNWR